MCSASCCLYTSQWVFKSDEKDIFHRASALQTLLSFLFTYFLLESNLAERRNIPGFCGLEKIQQSSLCYIQFPLFKFKCLPEQRMLLGQSDHKILKKGTAFSTLTDNFHQSNVNQALTTFLKMLLCAQVDRKSFGGDVNLNQLKIFNTCPGKQTFFQIQRRQKQSPIIILQPSLVSDFFKHSVNWILFLLQLWIHHEADTFFHGQGVYKTPYSTSAYK